MIMHATTSCKHCVKLVVTVKAYRSEQEFWRSCVYLGTPRHCLHKREVPNLLLLQSLSEIFVLLNRTFYMCPQDYKYLEHHNRCNRFSYNLLAHKYIRTDITKRHTTTVRTTSTTPPTTHNYDTQLRHSQLQHWRQRRTARLQIHVYSLSLIGLVLV